MDLLSKIWTHVLYPQLNVHAARTLFHDTQRDTSARVASDVVAAGSQAFHLACYHKNSLLPLRFSAEY